MNDLFFLYFYSSGIAVDAQICQIKKKKNINIENLMEST